MSVLALEDPMSLECKSVSSMQTVKGEGQQRKFIEICQDFARDTSMHGVDRAINSRPRWKKVVWSILVLASASVATANFYEIIVSYRSYPVNTNIELKSHRKMKFPAVTICNLNMARYSSLDERIRNVLNKSQEKGEGEEKLEKEYRHQVIKVYGKRTGGIEKALFNITDMLISCKFDLEYCSHRDFEALENFQYGKCFTFNSDQIEPRTIEKAGNRNGLVLELDIQQDEYLPFVSTSGIKVLVHPQSDMAFPEDNGIIVGPGRSTGIGLRKLEINRQMPPWGKCIDTQMANNDERINMFREDFKYTSAVCEKTCYQQTVVKECRCCDGNYPCQEATLIRITGLDQSELEDGHLPECDEGDKKIANCMTIVRQSFYSGYLSCMNSCQPACKEVVYRTNYATGTWPGENFERTIVNKAMKNLHKRRKRSFPDPMTSAFVMNNFLRVEVYFENFVEELVTTNPTYDWNRLLSDIGGQVGLWLGFSVMTAMEIVEFMDDVVWCIVQKVQNSRNQRTKPENLM